MGVQKLRYIAAAVMFLTGAWAGQSTAEVNLAGWGGIIHDGGTNVGGLEFHGDVLLSYDRSEFSFGIGFTNVWFHNASTNTFVDGSGDVYFLARAGNATLTYGEIYGAGNLFPEDYFGMLDVTSNSDQVVRLDVQLGQHRIAVSNDLNGSSASEIEIGYSGQVSGYDVAIGFEADNDEIGLLVGRDFGRWGIQVATLQDVNGLPGPWNQLGLTLFHDFSSDFTVAGNISVGTDSTTGLQSYGFLATRRIGNATLKWEMSRDFIVDTVDVEVGFVIPFGKTQPAHMSRFNKKEFSRRFVR